MRVLSQLKSLGVQLSLDDFGTGYSSLSYLHKFPLDVLKIDRSFVAGLIDNRESQQVVKTIMSLAEGMGMGVVAEGIECEDQARQLNEMGCEFGQGYLFAKPMSGPEAIRLLESRSSEGHLASSEANALPGLARTQPRVLRLVGR